MAHKRLFDEHGNEIRPAVPKKSSYQPGAGKYPNIFTADHKRYEKTVLQAK